MLKSLQVSSLPLAANQPAEQYAALLFLGALMNHCLSCSVYLFLLISPLRKLLPTLILSLNHSTGCSLLSLSHPYYFFLSSSLVSTLLLHLPNFVIPTSSNIICLPNQKRPYYIHSTGMYLFFSFLFFPFAVLLSFTWSRVSGAASLS
jgi:hypothetical protein